MILAGLDAAAIAIPMAVAVVAGVVDAPEESLLAGLGLFLGFLVMWPALFLLLPIGFLMAAAEYIPRRIYRGRPIVASWNVWVAGRRHVVSLPEAASQPDFVWTDGVRIPLSWVATGPASGWATLNGPGFTGVVATDTNEAGLWDVLGGSTGSTQTYALSVDGGAAIRVRIADGGRRGRAGRATPIPRRSRLGRRRG